MLRTGRWISNQCCNPGHELVNLPAELDGEVEGELEVVAVVVAGCSVVEPVVDIIVELGSETEGLGLSGGEVDTGVGVVRDRAVAVDAGVAGASSCRRSNAGAAATEWRQRTSVMK